MDRRRRQSPLFNGLGLPLAVMLLFSQAGPLQAQQSSATAPDAEASFSVLPRQDKLVYYPCMDCHQALPVKSEPRQLYSPHVREQPHGEGRFWCLSCHDAEDRNQLVLLNGQPVAMDQAYLVCEQCHSPRALDWRHGAHGKRVGTWQGERTIYGCAECHNPHDPVLVPSPPDPPPPGRIGLPPPADHGVEPMPVWESVVQSPHR